MDHASFVMEQVAKTGRLHFNKGDHVVVQCPIHAGGHERTPSRKINISNSRYRPLESYCFACHDDQKRLTWNELAAVMHMTPLQGEDSDSEEGGEGLWLALPQPADFYGVEHAEIAQFAWKGSWRGIQYKLLKKLGATTVNSRDEPRIYFPIYVDGVEVGNTQCVINAKHEEASKIKYLHSGKWTQWTLYPIDIAFPMAEKCGYLLIVEGLRDALRLIQFGVPAVCIWGTNGWTRAKRDILIELDGVTKVIAMDGDEAGRAATDKIEADLKRNKVKHSVIRFEDGVDPGNLPKADIMEIKQLFDKSRSISINSPKALNDNRVVRNLMKLFDTKRKATG